MRYFWKKKPFEIYANFTPVEKWTKKNHFFPGYNRPKKNTFLVGLRKKLQNLSREGAQNCTFQISKKKSVLIFFLIF
jgi:hypothetical protein